MARAAGLRVDFRSRLIAFSALALAVGTGIAGFLLGGAPAHYAPINAAALLLACVVLVPPTGRIRSAGGLATILAALTLLAASLIFGPATEGVHRWLAVGPIVLHIGMLTIPALCVVLATQRLAIALPTVAAAMALVWAQPDTASALALFCAVSFACAADARKGKWLLAVVALAGLLLTVSQPDPLQAVPFVETAIGDAWRAMPWLGALQALALILALVIPPAVLARGAARRTAPALALAGAMTGFALAGLIAAYPQPLVGYGASAVLGYGLALALLQRVADR